MVEPMEVVLVQLESARTDDGTRDNHQADAV